MRVRHTLTDLRLHTIGDAPAQGLCGSGLLDAVAALLDLGVLDWTGLIDVDARDRLPAPIRARVLMRGEERLVVLARVGEHGAEREITLTQDDVEITVPNAVIGASKIWPELHDAILRSGYKPAPTAE